MKEIPESIQSYLDLKSITDAVYSGKKKTYGKEVINLLDDYGIKIRQDDGKIHSINISIPSSINDSIVVGLRYKKEDDSFTEDHFLFQKDHDLKAYYKGSFEKIAPEYVGTHKEQIQQKEENLSAEKSAWIYMNRELAKLNVITECYNKIFDNIEINENAYNQFLQLVLDSFSSQLVTGLTRFFDKRKDSWSLYKLGLENNRVKQIELRAQDLISLRHKQVAHFANGYELKSNYLLLSDNGSMLAKEVINEVHELLSEVGREKYAGSVYALTWAGVENSLDVLVENLELVSHILKNMDTAKIYDLREEMRKSDST